MTRLPFRLSALALALYYGSISDHAAPPSSDDVRQLDALQARGRAQTLYPVDNATVGTRTDTPLAQVPQSIQVVPRERLKTKRFARSPVFVSTLSISRNRRYFH